MLDSLKADKTRAGGKDEAPASGPANTGTPGKRTPSERARLAALARWGKYKGKGKQKKGGGRSTPEAREAAKRQKAAENRTATFSELGMFEDATAALEGLAAGKPVDDDGGLVKMGLAERGKDGTLRLTTAGKQVYNAAGRGDVGAAKDAMSRGRDKAPAGADGKPLPPGVSVGTADAATEAALREKAGAAEEKPKGGGGGGGGAKPKPTEDDKAKAKAEARAKTATETAAAVGLRSLDALRQAADAGGAQDAGLARLGLLDAEGNATDQGRRALVALERGDVRQYRAALQDAAARIEREAAAQAREIERAAARADADAEREARVRADERRRLLREMGETQKAAIKQTASERAMFANMGSSGGGGAGGGKPSGGTGGLWKRDPETGKRTPEAGHQTPPKPGTPRAEQAGGAPDDAKEQAAATVARAEAGQVFNRTFADDDALFDEVPREAYREYVARTHRDEYTNERVPINRLVAETNSFDAGRVHSFMSEPTIRADDAPAVMRYRGADYLMDGHHRTLSRAALGESNVLARVFDVSGVEREPEVILPNRRRPVARTTKGNDMSSDTLLPNVLLSLSAIAEELSPATKAGRRNSAADQALIDAIHEAAEEICDLAMSLGAEGEAEDEAEAEPMDDGAVKMLGEDRVGGYAVRFGGPDEPDLSPFRDYFTKTTDFWIDAWQTRPMLYHHAQDAATKDAPVVGRWTAARVDDVGVWLEGQLDMAHRYAGAVKELVRRGVLKLSSDSAPHLVVRAAGPNGTHEVKRWPLLAASLTPSPAEPRLMPIAALKAAFDAAGLLPPAELIDSPEADDSDPVEVAPDATKTAADERARRLRIELTLLEMEAA